jgi:TonB family protein
MKVCPKCGQSFADGFSYCPKDAAQLSKYDLRGRMQQQEELKFLIESESLLGRLKREVVNAAGEFKTNPRGFLKGLFKGQGGTKQRKRLLGAGLATGVGAYVAVFLVVTLIGYIKLTISGPEAIAFNDPFPLNEVNLIIPVLNEKVERAKTQAKSSDGLLGGSLRQPQRSGGGGGGNEQRRATRGAAPLPSLNPQQAQPDPEPPVIAHSTLIIRPSVFVDPNSLQHMKGVVGTAEGPIAPPSRGKGPGTGIGNGQGPGYEDGIGGNIGGGPRKDGGGPLTGTSNDIYVMGPELKPTILYREKAKYTEEARQNRVQGTVMLNIVFGADGLIHNIRVVRGLPNGLTETAIEAAQRIRFHPATRNGKAVNVSATLEFSFNLY